MALAHEPRADKSAEATDSRVNGENTVRANGSFAGVELTPETLRLLPSEFVKEHKLLPLDVRDRTLRAAAPRLLEDRVKTTRELGLDETRDRQLSHVVDKTTTLYAILAGIFTPEKKSSQSKTRWNTNFPESRRFR